MTSYDETADLGSVVKIYDIAQLQSFTSRVVDNYYSLNDAIYIDTIEQHKDSDRPDGIQQVEMIVNKIEYDATDKYNEQIFISPDDLGPLSWTNKKIKRWLRSISSFSLVFKFDVKYPDGLDVSNECYHYTMTQFYNFETRGNIAVKLDMTRSVCDKDSILEFTSRDDLFWLSLVALILTGFHAGSTIHYFWVIFKHLKRLEAGFEKRMNQREEAARMRESFREQKISAMKDESDLRSSYMNLEKKNEKFRVSA